MMITITAVGSALLVTLMMLVVTLIGSAILGIPVAFARMSRFRALKLLAAAFIGVIRGAPPLAWLFIVFFTWTVGGFKPGAMVASLITLIVVNSAYFAENYRGGIEAVSPGLREAAAALGLSRQKQMWLVTVPLSLKVIIGSSSSIAINIVKETAIASLIGAQELTFWANAKVAAGENGMVYFSIVGALYLAISIVLGVIARRQTNLSIGPASV